MCSPYVLPILQAGQGISQASTNYFATKIEQSQFKAKASIEDANAKIIEGQAKTVDYQRQLSENRLRQDSENLRATQITAMGASGVALDSPSFQNILDTTDMYEAIDISLLRQSAGYQKESLLNQANQRRQLSSSYEDTARQLGKSARMGLIVDTFNTASNVSTSYMTNKATFEKYKLNNSKTSYGSYQGRGYIKNPI